jgi:2-C-methyl-D-erythritol 4-phosphate cytidylyltransferase
MIYAGILAAGMAARRTREDMPKPFQLLGDKPIIMHTVEQFFVNANIAATVIVVPEQWRVFAEETIAKYNTFGFSAEIINGGANKTISTKMLFRHIATTYGIKDGDVLIAHDAIRPFVTQRIIDENIAAAAAHGAASTVIPTNDTIVVTNDGATLAEIPPKSTMLAEQTPFAFRLDLLGEMFDKADKQGINLESEKEITRLYLKLGGEIRFVMGEYSNMKIVNPYDLEIANALIREMR